MALNDLREFIEQMVNSGASHAAVSKELEQMFPGHRGHSEMSVRRFCSENGITRRSGVKDREVEEEVKKAVMEVGPTYGRKTMHGLLRSKGIVCSENSVRIALKNVCPEYHEARASGTATLLNPVPYVAEYFGHKLHMDQNEKLVMFGVTHVSAIDGFSRKVVGFITLPVKNSKAIYDHLFRTILTTHGLWDQVRVDHGTEFFLTLHVQEMLADLRANCNRLPYCQTQSSQNLVVERFWVEINNRVNYPVKDALIRMAESGLNMDDNLVRFSVSWVTMRTCQIGVHSAISAWNNHHIPGTVHGYRS
jgi:hypothetical protein